MHLQHASRRPRTFHLVVAATVACLAHAPPLLADVLKVPTSKYATIQAAVLAANPGDSIEVAAGTYLENVEIETDDIELRGEGALIDGQYLDPCIYVEADRVTVSGLRLVNGSYGIYAYGSDIALVDNEIRAANEAGVYVYGDGVRVAGNSIRSCVEAGILIETATDSGKSVVEDNELRDCSGLSCQGGQVTLRKNRVLQDGFGVYVQPTHPSLTSLVAGNRVERSLYYGFVAIAAGAGKIVVENNVASDVNAYCIYAAPEKGEIVVRKNEVSRAGYHGVLGAGDTDFGLLRIEDNRIRDCRSGGLYYENDHSALVPMLLAKGNEIENCGGDGIFINAYQAELLDNRISKCKRDGIFAEGSAIRIENNDVRSNGFDGIHVLGHAEVFGNVIQKILGSGIDLSDGSQGVVVRDNVVTGNGHEGIDNDSQNVEIHDNVFTKNGRGVGPDFAGAGHGNGTVTSFFGNQFGTGGPLAKQRLEFTH